MKTVFSQSGKVDRSAKKWGKCTKIARSALPEAKSPEKYRKCIKTQTVELDKVKIGTTHGTHHTSVRA